MAAAAPALLRRSWLASPADRLALRVAAGATLGFALALSFGWEFSFLVPMLAVQMLVAMPRAPTLGQGLAIPIVLFVASNGALAVASFLSETPTVQLLVIGLIILWTFYAQRFGAPQILILLTQICFCAIPLFSTIDLALGHKLAGFLVRSSFAAAATVWICHVLVPAPVAQVPPSAPALQGLSPRQAALVAISDTLVIMPLVAWFMIDGRTSGMVIIVTTLNLLREVDASSTRRMAAGLVLGNLLGVVMGIVGQELVYLTDNLVHFLMIVFLTSLVLGDKLARGHARAPLFSLTLASFILVLGLGVTPLPSSAEEAAVVRIIRIAVASLYALGALSLMGRLRRIHTVD